MGQSLARLTKKLTAEKAHSLARDKRRVHNKTAMGRACIPASPFAFPPPLPLSENKKHMKNVPKNEPTFTEARLRSIRKKERKDRNARKKPKSIIKNKTVRFSLRVAQSFKKYPYQVICYNLRKGETANPLRNKLSLLISRREKKLDEKEKGTHSYTHAKRKEKGKGND